MQFVFTVERIVRSKDRDQFKFAAPFINSFTLDDTFDTYLSY